MLSSSRVTGSIVTYHQDPKDILQLCRNLLFDEPALSLWVVDNGQDPNLRAALAPLDVRYVNSGSNMGFGRGHNLVMENLLSESGFHFVINPDIRLSGAVIPVLREFLTRHDDVGAVMPRVLNPDGSVQHLCKKLPSPFDVLARRFAPPPLLRVFEDSMRRYELRHLDYDKVMQPPSLSGCFLGLRPATLRQVGLFDPRFFLYFEDFDLIRRIRAVSRTVYLPSATVIHEHTRGSYRNWRLLKAHLRSAYLYFSKWGWLFDADRKRWNADAEILAADWSPCAETWNASGLLNAAVAIRAADEQAHFNTPSVQPGVPTSTMDERVERQPAR
jgi:GT2 family glycosyltransferase